MTLTVDILLGLGCKDLNADGNGFQLFNVNRDHFYILEMKFTDIEDFKSTVEPGYKRTGYRRNLVIRDENTATKFFYIIKPGYRRNWL